MLDGFTERVVFCLWSVTPRKGGRVSLKLVINFHSLIGDLLKYLLK